MAIISYLEQVISLSWLLVSWIIKLRGLGRSPTYFVVLIRCDFCEIRVFTDSKNESSHILLHWICCNFSNCDCRTQHINTHTYMLIVIIFLKKYYTDKFHGWPRKGVLKIYFQICPQNRENNLHFYGRYNDDLILLEAAWDKHQGTEMNIKKQKHKGA